MSEGRGEERDRERGGSKRVGGKRERARGETGEGQSERERGEGRERGARWLHQRNPELRQRYSPSRCQPCVHVGKLSLLYREETTHRLPEAQKLSAGRHGLESASDRSSDPAVGGRPERGSRAQGPFSALAEDLARPGPLLPGRRERQRRGS